MAEQDREAEIDQDELSYLMIWYGDIRNRGHRGQHYEPVMLTEIQAYEHFLSKLGIEMDGFDWEIIFRLDDVWCASVPKIGEEPPPPPKAPKPTRH